MKRAPTLERIWMLSTLESIVQGQLVEPDIDTLKYLTAPTRVWDELNPAWPPDHVSTILDSVATAQRLAIAKLNAAWLTELYACWEMGPGDVHYFDVHFLFCLKMQGEIGLALSPAGPRPLGWTDEVVSELEEEGFLAPNATPADRAWLSLARGNREEARRALHEYEQFVATLPALWEQIPEQGIREILTFPSAFFELERRALAALLERK